jgi:hypothetical protein
MSSNKETKPFTFRFIDIRSGVLLELTNTTDQALKSVEILSVFLKDEGEINPPQAHIRFDALKCIQPKEKAVLSHRTWINGRPSDPADDRLDRLRALEGKANPYVLDISWEDAESKTRFQRIPLGTALQQVATG